VHLEVTPEQGLQPGAKLGIISARLAQEGGTLRIGHLPQRFLE
jgi:hypothetical protein